MIARQETGTSTNQTQQAVIRFMQRSVDSQREIVMMLRRLRNLCLDEAVLCRTSSHLWRVEYLYLERGNPHYRVYVDSHYYGIVPLTGNGEHVRYWLAVYLVMLGWRSDATWTTSAMTPLIERRMEPALLDPQDLPAPSRRG